jgi:hypothetical protein
VILPREHGAWGLLLQPFVCAAILGRRWDWLLVPAVLLILTAFVAREPLVILARQRWVWRDPRPEAGAAWRQLLWQAPLGLSLFAVCAFRLPLSPLAALGGTAAAMTVLAVWMAVRNRQRSIALQVVSSAGLATTALLGALVAAREIPVWAWQLWGLLSLHGAASILTVQARLDARTGSRRGLRRWAWAFQAGQGLLALLAGIPLGVPVAFSAGANVYELVRLGAAAGLNEPLTRVGFRTLGWSLLHSGLVVAVLW